MRQGAAPTVLTAWTGTLLRALKARGIDGAALAAAAGIPPDALADPDHRVPLAASTRLWAEAVAVTGDPAFGIEVSRHVRATTFHALGQAFLASPTLRAALERAARYSRVTADHAIGAAEASGGEFRLAITWRPGAAVPAFEAVDAVFAAIVRSARFMLDRSVAPVRVELERPRPPATERFNSFFRCPIVYGAPANVLVFDRATVDRPVPAGNAELAHAGDSILVAYLAALEPDTVTDRTRRAVVDLLGSGEPSLVAVARRLDASPRTLQRLLAEEGTSFRQVLADVRCDLACAYLCEGGHTITDIAYLLGFSETAAFTRAFRRWTGEAPSRFVEQRRR